MSYYGIRDKISVLCRGPMEIISIVHTSFKNQVESSQKYRVSSVHTMNSQSPTNITKEEIDVLSVIDWDEYYVHNLVAHEE